jgi:hypothetical protein
MASNPPLIFVFAVFNSFTPSAGFYSVFFQKTLPARGRLDGQLGEAVGPAVGEPELEGGDLG